MDLIDLEKNKSFLTFYNMLEEANAQFNLTAITNKHEVYVLHFLDSVFVENKFFKGANVVDVGTGAGFPSIPLAIVRPDLNIVAVDALNKRINFVNSVIKELNLKNVKAIHARSEEIAKTNRESFDIATSRAVANLSTLLEWLAPLVKVGGTVVCYKGPNYNQEILEATKAQNMLGLKLEKVFEYNIENNKRALIIFKKISLTPIKYPRPNNKALKNPLK